MYSFTINVRRRHLALAIVLLLIGVWVTRTEPAGAGADPPGEGIAVVYIAVGTGFADALGVGPGAGLNGAPIILVPTNPPLDSATEAELIRLDPRTVIIVGGTSAVSTNMENTLVALLPNAAVSRIAGTNRYKTNAAFSAATFPIEGWVSVPSSAFTSLSPDVDDATIGNNFAYNVTTGALFAPIQLPQGAEILELQVHGYDLSGGSGVQVSLDRYDFAAGGLVLFTAVTTGAGGDTTAVDPTISTAGAEIVDNELYAYGISIAGANSTSLMVRNVMVHYRLGAPTG